MLLSLSVTRHVGTPPAADTPTLRRSEPVTISKRTFRDDDTVILPALPTRYAPCHLITRMVRPLEPSAMHPPSTYTYTYVTLSLSRS